MNVYSQLIIGRDFPLDWNIYTTRKKGWLKEMLVLELELDGQMKLNGEM